MLILKSNRGLCERMNKLQLQVLAAGHASVAKDWSGVVTNPSYSRLYYLLDGAFHVYGKDGTDFILSKGNCYLIPAGFSFTFSCDHTMEQVYFHVKLCDFDEIDLLKTCNKPLSYSFPVEKGTDYRSIAAAQGLLGCVQAQQEVYTSLYTLLSNYDIQLDRPAYSPQVRSAIAFIESHLTLQLSIKDIATHIFAAPSTLTRNFRRETGMTIGQYVDERIWFQAEQMLLSENVSILEISEQLGFCDQFYFARRFKEKFGASPSNYRKTTLI